MIAALVLLAQLHVATPVHDLHGKVKFVDEKPPVPQNFNPQAAKVINVTARQFAFDLSSQQIDQGDSVTFNITSADVEHGFFLESYMTQGVVVRPGQPVTVNIIATTPGTFTYFCSVFCGELHGSMNGRLTVNATAQQPPTIASFTPTFAPTTGGTPISITGANFVSGAKVRFGDTEALVTIVNTPTSITAITPARAAGSVLLTVTNPDGLSATAAAQFTFGSQPPPRPSRRRAVRR